MTTVQDYRNQGWTNANAWTSVQTSAAWPTQQKPVQIQQKKIAEVPQVSPSPPFQWSNSWDPVVVVPNPMTKIQKKPSSTPPPPQILPFQVVPTPSPSPAFLGEEFVAESSVGFENSDDSDDVGSNGKPKKKKTVEEKAIIEEELSKQNLYKTELCRSFCETGICRYGHKCQFAHGEHEIRPVMRHPKYKTEICKTFSNTGTCPYGNRCRFIHPGMNWNPNWAEDSMGVPQQSIELLVAAVEQLSTSPSPALSKTRVPSNSAPTTQYPTTDGLKDRESDIKALVDDDADAESKPRLAFFQNLTVL